MKQQLSILAGGVIAFCLPLQTQAQDTPAPAHIPTVANFGPKAAWEDITEVKVTNMQGATLGRIQGLALDLSNGRIVEVLVVSGQTLRMGGKTVGVPPLAFIPDAQNKVYQINMSERAFSSAPAFDLKNWNDSTQVEKVTAAYDYFGQEPNFLMAGEAPGRLAGNGQLLTPLGVVERMSKIIDMDVNDMNGKLLGRLESVVLDVPHGLIINAYISSIELGGPLKFSTVIPPTSLSFNAKRDHLLLDVTKVQYAAEPHVIFETGANGQVTGSREQAATTPHTDQPLVQGTSYRDITTTSQIYTSMQQGSLDTFGVEVATLEGRVTLRGTVDNPGTKVSIGAIAINLVKLDNVDNQIMVTAPIQVFPPSQSSAPVQPTAQSSN
jgi:sporulation protein YlmC with PRC-barrel domain